MISENKSVIAFNVSYLYENTVLVEAFYDFLFKKLHDKKLVPLPVTTYPFKDVAKAHQAIESGKTIGKLVLEF